MEAKIIDAERPQRCRAATAGEICTRGYAVMLGLLGRRRGARREAIDAEGWMHTGDLGTIDAEGYCNIVGRIKDMIIRGGENVYPREIEEFLYPASEDRRRAQVVGVPDAKYGRGGHAPGYACVTGRRRPSEEIRDFCRGQIAHYKVPALRAVRRRLPDDGHGQGAEIPDSKAMIENLGLREERTA